MQQIINLILLFSLLLSPPLSAQEKGGFFDEGFVKGTQKEKQEEKAQKQKNDTPAVKNILEQDSGLKAYSLGLIVNATEPEHYIKHTRAAIDTAAQNDLTITQIVAVGLMPKGNEARHIGLLERTNELMALKVLDGKLLPTEKVPERFKVSKSPTWVINTEKGSILVEGKDEIWEFFNTKGEFVEKGFSPVAKKNEKAPRRSVFTKDKPLF